MPSEAGCRNNPQPETPELHSPGHTPTSNTAGLLLVLPFNRLLGLYYLAEVIVGSCSLKSGFRKGNRVRESNRCFFLILQSCQKLPDYYIQEEYILVDIPGSAQSIPYQTFP